MAYHTVVSSATTEEFCQTFTGRQIAAAPIPIQNAGNNVAPAAYLSKPAEAVLNILHKQKGLFLVFYFEPFKRIYYAFYTLDLSIFGH